MFPWINDIKSAEFIGNQLGWMVVFFALASAFAGFKKRRHTVIILAVITALLGIWQYNTNNIVNDFNKQEIDNLKQKSGPWKLSIEQRQKFIQDLKKDSGGNIIIASRMSDADSLTYAENIASALSEANWSVGPVINASLNDFEGIIIFPNLEDQAHSSLKTLINALNSAGIKFRVDKIRTKSIPKILPNRIYIIVGYRAN